MFLISFISAIWVLGESDEADSENQEVAGRCESS